MKKRTGFRGGMSEVLKLLFLKDFNGAPGVTRTRDPRFRNPFKAYFANSHDLQNLSSNPHGHWTSLGLLNCPRFPRSPLITPNLPPNNPQAPRSNQAPG